MLGSMSTNFEIFKEELNAGLGWGRVWLSLGLGLATHSQHQIKIVVNVKKFQIFEEELNTGVGWGQGQIKVGVGVIDN